MDSPQRPPIVSNEIPVYRFHTPSNSQCIRSQLDQSSSTDPHSDSNPPHYVLSTITPSQSHVRQLQHLYDVSLPIRYTSKFYNKLVQPDYPLNRTLQSQTFVLTSTPQLDSISPSSDDSLTSPNQTDLTIESFLDRQNGLLGSVTVPKFFQPQETFENPLNSLTFSLPAADDSEKPAQNVKKGSKTKVDTSTPKQTSFVPPIHLHSSVLKPTPYDIIALGQSNKLGNKPKQPKPAPKQSSSSWFSWGQKTTVEDETDSENPIELDPVMLHEAATYQSHHKHLKIPEYSQSSSSSSETPNQQNSESQSYVHTVSSQPAIDVHQNYHQVVGSWVVRPCDQASLSGLLSDFVYTANTTLSPMVSSVSSWFSSTFASSQSPQQSPQTSQHNSSAPSKSIAPQPMRACYLCTIAIAPQAQSTGLGSLLLFNCIEFCIKNYDCEQLYLHVLESNRSAIDLYKHFGFSVQSCAKNYFPLSQLHRTTHLGNNSSVHFEVQREQEMLRQHHLQVKMHQQAGRSRTAGGQKAPTGALIVETDLDGIDEAVNSPSEATDITSNNDEQENDKSLKSTEAQPLSSLDGVALDQYSEPIKQSYLIAENETGNALYMCLDMYSWKNHYRHVILTFLSKKLNLDVSTLGFDCPEKKTSQNVQSQRPQVQTPVKPSEPQVPTKPVGQKVVDENVQEDSSVGDVSTNQTAAVDEDSAVVDLVDDPHSVQ